MRVEHGLFLRCRQPARIAVMQRVPDDAACRGDAPRCPDGDGGAPRARGLATVSVPRRRLTGFTLLEVLVAIALLALALTALVRLSGLEANSTAHLRDATLAQWVAANALAETRLREPFPAVGRREGEERMGMRRWRWRMQVQSTEDASIRRLEVQVFALQDAGVQLDNDADPVASLTGFVAQR